jgi:hypothetical protein
MKKTVRSFVLLGALCSGVQLFAQDFSLQPISNQHYGGKETPTLRNQQKVQESFQSLSSVYTLDFSAAVAKNIPAEVTTEAAKMVREAGYIEYSNATAIASLFAQKPEVLSVKIPFKGQILIADLTRTELFGEGFQVSSNDPSKVTGITTGLYYQGTLRGNNAVVTFSFFPDEFSALILTDDLTNSIIEAGFVRTADNTSGTHIVYTDDDLKVEVNHPCTAESLAQYGIAVEQLSGKVIDSHEHEKALVKCVTYFWETSYNMYQSLGTTQAVTNYMTTLFNNFQIIYNNESIGSKLNQLYIWTTADAYADNLNTFSSNRSSFGANLATLFSTTGGGGVAWVDVLCNSSDYYRHGFCGSVGSSFSAVPNYSWPVNVSTHEVGHNLGSPHTHACSWTGGAIDGCGPTAGYSEGCTAALPSGGGTIMSYCHLVSGVGINFNNGFGPQPGNLIRSRINGCITLTCETNGGSTCASAFEPNETQAAAATIVSGVNNSAAISSGTDVDFYKITTSATTNNTFSLVGPSGVDFDLVIYNSAMTQLGAGTSGSATETVSLTSQAAGTYYIKVFGYSGANSALCYTINATAVGLCASAYEANETIAAAATISTGTTITAGISTTTDNDYYKIVTSTTTNNTYNLVGPSGVDFDLAVFNSGGTLLGSSTSGSATETVSLTSQAAGTYYIRVYGYNGANSTSCYTLSVASTGASVASGLDAGDGLNPFPNPTTDKLYLGGIYSGKLFNQLGQTVMVFDGSELSLKQLQSGVYLLQVNGSATIYRIVKE